MSETLINKPDLIRQPIDAVEFNYSGNTKKKGCDIDFLIDHSGQGYTIIEVKYKGVNLPDGQRWTLEKMAKDFYKAGKPTIILLVEHEQRDHCQPIVLKDCKVAAFYMPPFMEWMKPQRQIKTLEATKKFINKFL